jgi:hypothetical protein
MVQRTGEWAPDVVACVALGSASAIAALTLSKKAGDHCLEIGSKWSPLPAFDVKRLDNLSEGASVLVGPVYRH